jgi:hypothetical protein
MKDIIRDIFKIFYVIIIYNIFMMISLIIFITFFSKVFNNMNEYINLLFSSCFATNHYRKKKKHLKINKYINYNKNYKNKNN